MSATRLGFGADKSRVILIYEVIREPDIRREVLQLHRWEASGRSETGRLKVWVAAPHEQVTLRSPEMLMFLFQL